MKEIKLSSGENEFSISLIDEQTEDLLLEYDVRLKVVVKSNGFTGGTKCWVISEAMQVFCQSLINLNEKRSGSALLESMSPGELAINVHSIDTLGHMAVSGKLGCLKYTEHTTFKHRVSFGFELDPNQIVQIASTPWVSEYSKL